jgi:prevent-host-death family protein
MALTTISSRQFNQDVSHAKRAAQDGPVVITDRGEPAFVLLRHEVYLQLVGESPSIRDLLAQPGSEADFEFEPPRMGNGLFRIPDLS